MDPFERTAKDLESTQCSALVWRLAWSQAGICWLQAVEECKRLKREKGTHKKVRDPKALGRKAIVTCWVCGINMNV